MVKKRTAPIWITFVGDYNDANLVEMHEDEVRADLRILIDPSRSKKAVNPKLAVELSDWLKTRTYKTEFYSEENLQEALDLERLVREVDINQDFYWFTARLAKGREEEGLISKPAYWQMHNSLEEALRARDLRTEVSQLSGDNYEFDVLFKLKDKRRVVARDPEKPRNITKPLGAPKRPEEEIQRHSYAGNLTTPLLERYLEFQEKYKEENPDQSNAEAQRYLIFTGMLSAEKEGNLKYLPFLHEEGLTRKDTSVMLRLRVNDADNEILKAFMKKFKVRSKQDFLCRTVYQGLLAVGMRTPRGYPEED